MFVKLIKLRFQVHGYKTLAMIGNGATDLEVGKNIQIFNSSNNIFGISRSQLLGCYNTSKLWALVEAPVNIFSVFLFSLVSWS